MVFLEKLEMLLNFLSRPIYKRYHIVLWGDVDSNFDMTTDKTSVRELTDLLKQLNMKYNNPILGTAFLDIVLTSTE